MTNKRSYPTFEVVIWGEDDQPLKTIIVRPVPFRGKKGGLADVIALQEKLLKDFVEHDGRLASLLINPSTWKAMTQLAGLLPVVGESTVGFDIEPLANANDVTQLGRIFFSESIKDDLERETDKDGNVINSPSLISKIHDINFSATLFRLVREREDRIRESQIQNLSENLKSLQESEAQAILK